MISKINIKASESSMESLLYIIAFSVVIITISGIGLYQAAQGETLIALIDFSICLLFMFLLKKILCGQLTIKIKLFTIFICTLFALSIAYFTENIVAIYWVYPIITGTFFLLCSQLALPINIFIIIISMSIAFLNTSTHQLINLTSSLILMCVAGYIFSVRSEIYQKQLASLINIDPLTKLKNRYSLDEELIKKMELHKQNIQTASLLILDLDNFKKINDIHGHTVGDNTLISFASMLKDTIQKTDKIYRYGGDEFIIIANNTPLKKAGKLAEQLRELTEGTIRADKDTITVSIGVAEVSHGDTETSWLHRADKALYKAKYFNRNSVFLAHNDRSHKQFNFNRYDMCRVR